MGIIHIEDMEFYAFHGCYEEEQIIGSRFLVNLSIETDMDKPSATDDIRNALNYQSAFRIVQQQMEIKSHLLEHVGKRILDALYEKFEGRIIKASVKIAKMNPPMGGKMKSVSVTMTL